MENQFFGKTILITGASNGLGENVREIIRKQRGKSNHMRGGTGNNWTTFKVGFQARMNTLFLREIWQSRQRSES